MVLSTYNLNFQQKKPNIIKKKKEKEKKLRNKIGKNFSYNKSCSGGNYSKIYFCNLYLYMYSFLIHNIASPGSLLGNPNNGTAITTKPATEKTNPNHHAPTQRGSTNVMSILSDKAKQDIPDLL
jgi:hypothetical protein